MTLLAWWSIAWSAGIWLGSRLAFPPYVWAGVALAGVQALYRLSLKKDAQIRQQQEQIRALKQQTEELKSHNRELAQRVEELSKVQQAMPALEARLARLEAQEQTTRARLALE